MVLGWVPPGYKYLGPGNDLNQGEPTNPSDAAAKEHDEAYDQYIKSGKNPYLYFSPADQRFIDQTKDAKDWGGKVGHYFFRTKRAFAPKLSTDSEPETSGVSRAGKRTKPPAHIFINQARAKKKRASLAAQQRTLTMSDGGAQQDNTAQSAARVERAADGSGGSGGGGSSGGGGVGVSTGSFDNQTHYDFLGGGWVRITAYASRLVHINMPASEEYHRIFVRNGGDTTQKGKMSLDDAHTQIWTPWSLVDANAWGCWFQPSDWQFIQNSMAELNVDTFEQEIFNVVLKTVTEQNSGGAEAIKVYNNDLTASLMVALDSNNSLPYTPAAATSETLGFYPWKPTIPAPYRYYFYVPRNLSVTYAGDTQAVTDTVGQTSAYNSRFLTIENTTPITLLRTGDEFATGIYKFDCEPLKLTHLWQNNRALGMPPLLGALPPNDNPINIQKPNTNRFGQSQLQGSNVLTEVTRLRPAQIGFAQPHDVFESSDSGPFKVPLISMFPTDSADHDGNGNVRYMYSKQHGASYAQQSADYVERYTYDPAGTGGRNYHNGWTQDVPWTPETQLQGILTDRDPIGGKTGIHPQNIMNTYGPLTAFPHTIPIYPQGQIWDKEIDLEHKPRMHANAPFVCKGNPPGQLFVRLAPNLTDQFDPNSSNLTRIVTYGTFFWKGKLTFIAKMRPNQTWNPIHQITTSDGGSGRYDDITKWLPSPTGHMKTDPLLTAPIARNIY